MAHRLLLTSVILLACLMSSASADTQSEQKKVKAEISKVSKSYNKARATSKSLQSELERNEAEINRLSRKEYQAEQKIKAISDQMVSSSKEKQVLTERIKVEKEILAKQLLAMYSSGEESHLRLLLKQDDPSDISRTTKYFEYLNTSRVNRIQNVRKSLEEIEKLEAKITKDSQELKSLRVSLLADKKSLQAELAKNSKALKSAKSVESSQRSKLNQLKKKEAALQAVFDNLIKKQKADAAALARRAAVAKKKTAQKTQAAQKTVTKKATTTKKAAPKGKQTSLNFVANRPFSSLRGRLSWPVKGRITKNYGSRRNAKQKWKGVLIKAPGGQRVHAVARGKVEYAGPVRGYGYVVILQHDKSYRTLYAYNRAVYRKTGDVVNAGAVIAAVGNSGGQNENALYFEIRRGASTQNPARWCK
ncbi:murein hydrolase activator EnvC family protein [Leucothrix pacifica]|uniref:Peptidase M23 n=1 Tax=Leucothrix pacifica TaxID=1247513 RepID=A0A317CNT4_9GAMM|nr:peptidoglycan DD-metalloendopeptidase family protein [Leucothrix pacifica]PWQ99999.1 peptidase M23 [Leucothrix pacifica]